MEHSAQTYHSGTLGRMRKRLHFSDICAVWLHLTKIHKVKFQELARITIPGEGICRYFQQNNKGGSRWFRRGEELAGDLKATTVGFCALHLCKISLTGSGEVKK
jgi:hypothetical protein